MTTVARKPTEKQLERRAAELAQLIAEHRVVRVEHTEAEHFTVTVRVDMPEWNVKSGEIVHLHVSSFPSYYYPVTWDSDWNCHACRCKSYEFAHRCKHGDRINEICIERAHQRQSVPARQYEDWSSADAPIYTSDVSALPVAVRVLDGRTACLDLGDHREVVRTCELPRIFLNGYRLIEKDDPERHAWDVRMSQLEDRTSEGVADAAWIAQVRTSLPERTSDIVTDDDMAAHIDDSIRSDEFTDPNSCRYCGILCKGGVCMDCLDIAA